METDDMVLIYAMTIAIKCGIPMSRMSKQHMSLLIIDKDQEFVAYSLYDNYNRVLIDKDSKVWIGNANDCSSSLIDMTNDDGLISFFKSIK